MIDAFVDSLSVDAGVDKEWRAFIGAKRAEELERIIAEEGLDADETRDFVADAFRDGRVPRTGTAITRILPPVSRFSKAGDHGAKKQTVLERLSTFFERYAGLI